MSPKSLLNLIKASRLQSKAITSLKMSPIIRESLNFSLNVYKSLGFFEKPHITLKKPQAFTKNVFKKP
jgi:hypothetical protein